MNHKQGARVLQIHHPEYIRPTTVLELVYGSQASSAIFQPNLFSSFPNQVMWWKGRVKEHERSYGKASEYYERVYEKHPTIEHLNSLAR